MLLTYRWAAMAEQTECQPEWFSSDATISYAEASLARLLDSFGALIDWLWSPGPVIVFQSLFGPLWVGPFQVLSLLGDVQTALIIGSVVLWLHGRRPAYAVLAVVALGMIVSSLIWIPLDLPRPHHPRITVHEVVPGASFPSGHTITSTLLWGSLAWFGWLPKFVAVIVVGAVMVSRLYLGVHYLGDVLTSPLLGLALLFAFRHLWPGIWHHLAGSSGWSVRLFRALRVLGIVAILGSLVAFIVIPPDRWGIPGGIVGAAIGLPLEYRFVRFSPAPLSWRRQRLQSISLGLGGLVPPVLVGLLMIDKLPALSATLIALGALWGLLVAPGLCVRLGLATTGQERVAQPAGQLDPRG